MHVVLATTQVKLFVRLKIYQKIKSVKYNNILKVVTNLVTKAMLIGPKSV